MPAPDAFKILKYALAVFTFGFGVLLLAGVVMQDPVPPQMRYTFGAVLVLMGVYRFVLTKIQSSRSPKRDA